MELAADGFPNLKPYSDLDENTIVWNTSVIAREYVPPIIRELTVEKFQSISVDGIHPDTGEYLKPDAPKELYKEYQQKLDEWETKTKPTHFKDFAEILLVKTM